MKHISITFIGILISVLLYTGVGSVTTGLSRNEETISEAASPAADPFEKAVELIKKYETLHQPRHWPLVGYGHKVLPGEKYSRAKALSEKEADALLRADLRKNCAIFRSYGADSILLGTLAYNIGSGSVKRSSVAAALKSGNREIRNLYLQYCRYRGKVHQQIRQRRIEEFDALFIKEPGKDSIDVKKEIITLGENTAELLSFNNIQFT